MEGQPPIRDSNIDVERLIDITVVAENDFAVQSRQKKSKSVKTRSHIGTRKDEELISLSTENQSDNTTGTVREEVAQNGLTEETGANRLT